MKMILGHFSQYNSAQFQRNGWAWDTHRAMLGGVILLTPNPNLQHFLETHRSDLEKGATTIADGKKLNSLLATNLFNPQTELRGGNHYIRVESVLPGCQETLEGQQLTPQEYFSQHPLSVEALKSSKKPNIFNTIFHFHHRCIRLLKEIKVEEEKKGFASDDLLKKLAWVMGVASHFYQDWRQPLHTTVKYDWSLGHDVQGGMHKFLENAQSDSQERAWLAGMRLQDPELRRKYIKPYDSQTLQKNLAFRIQDSYLNYVWVEKIEAEIRQNTSNSKEYKKQLKAFLTSETKIPLWMNQATVFNAIMLHSAYEKAGCPHLLSEKSDFKTLDSRILNLLPPF